MIRDGKPHESIPLSVWKYQHDAQRFLSLYTHDSEEEIFSYVQPDKKPVTLRKIKVPALIIFAGNDEYRERPMKKLLKWFQENVKSTDKKMAVIEDAPHNFNGYETLVVNEVSGWLKQRFNKA